MRVRTGRGRSGNCRPCRRRACGGGLWHWPRWARRRPPRPLPPGWPPVTGRPTASVRRPRPPHTRCRRRRGPLPRRPRGRWPPPAGRQPTRGAGGGEWARRAPVASMVGRPAAWRRKRHFARLDRCVAGGGRRGGRQCGGRRRGWVGLGRLAPAVATRRAGASSGGGGDSGGGRRREDSVVDPPAAPSPDTSAGWPVARDTPKLARLAQSSRATAIVAAQELAPGRWAAVAGRGCGRQRRRELSNHYTDSARMGNALGFHPRGGCDGHTFCRRGPPPGA